MSILYDMRSGSLVKSKLYNNGGEIKSALLNDDNYVDMGLAKDYSGTGWYKATDTGTVFNKDVPEGETHIFPNDPTEYTSVYTKEDAKSYANRAATSNVTDMNNIFYSDTSFNEDISHWDVSNVTDMTYMFAFTELFNQDISSWNVSNVTVMQGVFYGATSFNQDISKWNTSSVIHMSYMFNEASSFNQDLSQWCVPRIKTSPTSFNENTTNWSLPKPVWGTCPSVEDGTVTLPPFEPLSLFDGGNQGVWYDPSDSLTIFTGLSVLRGELSVGDPVATVLDKSKALAKTELVPDPYFNSPESWNLFRTSISDNKLVFRGLSLARARAEVDMKAGKIYEIHVDITYTKGSFKLDLIHASGGTYNLWGYNAHTSSSSPFMFLAREDYAAIAFVSSGSAFDGVVTRVSVLEVAGNHATQNVLAARPTLGADGVARFLTYDKVDDALITNLPAMTATTVVATDDGVAINYPVAITSGDYMLNSNSSLGYEYGRIIIDGELSAQEKANITSYFNSKRGV